jgi:HEAT repeat protein
MMVFPAVECRAAVGRCEEMIKNDFGGRRRGSLSIGQIAVLALIMFGASGSAWAQAAQEQQLHDADAKVRERAARDLGNAGNTLYVPSLAALVQDPDEKVRMTVVRALIRLGTDGSLSPLTVAMRDSIPEIRYQAIDGIINHYLPGYVDTGFGGLFRSVSKRVSSLFSDVDSTAVDADTRLDQIVVESLRRAIIGAPDINTRIRAARAAGILRAAALASDMTETVFGGQVELTAEVLRALRKIPTFSEGVRLIFLLSYPQVSIQREASITLGVFRVQEAIPELRRLYENTDDKDVRKAALEALAFMPNADTAPVFESALLDREGNIRASAALALGRLKDEKYLSVIEQARLKEKDEGVRLAITFALIMNGKRELLDQLVPALDSKFRSGEAEAYLIEAARDEAVRDGLYARLYHRDPDVRMGLCRVLAASGDNRSISYLEVLLKDRNKEVVAEASRAIRLLRARLGR